jgi:hypothetical protein
LDDVLKTCPIEVNENETYPLASSFYAVTRSGCDFRFRIEPAVVFPSKGHYT